MKSKEQTDEIINANRKSETKLIHGMAVMIRQLRRENPHFGSAAVCLIMKKTDKAIRKCSADAGEEFALAGNDWPDDFEVFWKALEAERDERMAAAHEGVAAFKRAIGIQEPDPS